MMIMMMTMKMMVNSNSNIGNWTSLGNTTIAFIIFWIHTITMVIVAISMAIVMPISPLLFFFASVGASITTMMTVVLAACQYTAAVLLRQTPEQD